MRFLLFVLAVVLAPRALAQDDLPPIPPPPNVTPPDAARPDTTSTSTATSPTVPVPSPPPAASAPPALLRAADVAPAREPKRARPPMTRGRSLWLPQLSWGVVSTSAPNGDGGVGSRVQLTVPVWITGKRGSMLRVAPLVGYSWLRAHPGRTDQYEFGTTARIDSDVTHFHRHHVLFGAAVRVGRKPIAWQSELFWSPGTFGSWECGPHPEPDPEIDEHTYCESRRGPTAASFRFESGVTVWNAFIGWTAEVAWRNGERARSLGIRLGTTFH